jgi:hypothetical protein
VLCNGLPYQLLEVNRGELLVTWTSLDGSVALVTQCSNMLLSEPSGIECSVGNIVIAVAYIKGWIWAPSLPLSVNNSRPSQFVRTLLSESGQN